MRGSTREGTEREQNCWIATTSFCFRAIVGESQPVEHLCTLLKCSAFAAALCSYNCSAEIFLFLLLYNCLQQHRAKDDVRNVDDTENQLQLAGSRDCSSAALPAVSSNVKVPPRKVSDGACLTLRGRGRGWQLEGDGWCSVGTFLGF